MAQSVTIRVNGSTDATVAAATLVQVTERVGQSTQYRIEYSLDIAEGDFPLLKGKLGPRAELEVLSVTDDATECLVKGPIYTEMPMVFTYPIMPQDYYFRRIPISF